MQASPENLSVHKFVTVTYTDHLDLTNQLRIRHLEALPRGKRPTAPMLLDLLLFWFLQCQRHPKHPKVWTIGGMLDASCPETSSFHTESSILNALNINQFQ